MGTEKVNKALRTTPQHRAKQRHCPLRLPD